MSGAGSDPDEIGLNEPGSNPAEVETSLVRSSAVVAVGTALSRVTGFVRIAAIAYALGATTLAGTYSYANEAPNIVYELLLGGVLTATLVPLFVKHFETRDDDAASAIFTVAILALAAITVVGVVAAPWIVDLYTLNVHGRNVGAQQELATSLLRLFMPQMLFYGIVTLATAVLNARRRFLAAAFAPVLNNVVVIAVFLALPHIATSPLTVRGVLDDDALVLLIGLGTTAGVVVMALALLPPLGRLHLRLRFLPAWRHPAVSAMLRLSGWTVGYVVANQIALLVVTVLANGTDGGPFIYISAYAFFQLPHGLFAVSLMTTFTPEMASAAARNDVAALRVQLSRGLRLAAVVIAPAAALYLGLARPIIVALLQRGAFSGSDASVVADTLAMFAVGLLPFSIYLFAMRAFYARHDTFTPFWINCIENAVNIALAFPLYAWLGVPGLALAFSLAYFAGAGVALLVLHERLGGIEGRRIATTISKVVVAGAAVAGVSWAIGELVGWATTFEAFAAAFLGTLVAGIVYLGLLALLRVEELATLTALVPGRRGARPGTRV
ncbi:MAG: putative peptidoglycan lipid flippase [Actinomycetota bacterium]|nr:putative peptidoglycan lipid flippase [Actinomycetota bacterium]